MNGILNRFIPSVFAQHQEPDENNDASLYFNQRKVSAFSKVRVFLSEVRDKIKHTMNGMPSCSEITVVATYGAIFGSIPSMLIIGAMESLAEAGVIAVCAPATTVAILLVPMLAGGALGVTFVCAVYGKI